MGPNGHDERAQRNREQHARSQQGAQRSDPTPQYVYWIRRGVALAIVIAVLSLVAWAVTALVGLVAGSDDTNESNEGASNAAPKDSKDGTDKGEPAQENSPKTCDPASISMALTSERTSVAVGASMPFTLDLTNDGEADCILDVSPEQTSITIFSGEDRIWSNSDCDDSGTKALFMERKAKTSTGSSWNGERSNEKCDQGLPKVKAGTYRALAEYKKSVSNELVFQVK